METKLTSMNEMRTAAETVSSPSTPSPSPPWIELPGDVTANIVQRLGAQEILDSAQFVCATWWKVSLDPAMWRVIELDCVKYDVEYDLLCQCAVDRSQGQLIDLRITRFGDDELMHYIADRSSNLRRLTLASCDEVSGAALAKAVKKLPRLEMLHLIMVAHVHAKDIEAIGISCPMLKSFSYHWSVYPDWYELTESRLYNEYALAVGKTMPNLRHLQLLDNRMRNEGLEAILDGCPHLESLDIRGCRGLDLTGALGKRCSQQIENLRYPSERISDFAFDGVGESTDLECSSESSDFYDGSSGDDDYHCDL